VSAALSNQPGCETEEQGETLRLQLGCATHGKLQEKGRELTFVAEG
jgi:hypothetical protein